MSFYHCNSAILRCMDHEIIVWLNSDQEYTPGYCCMRNMPGTQLRPHTARWGATGKNRLTLITSLGKLQACSVSVKTPELSKPQEKKEVQKQFRKFRFRPAALENLRLEQKMCYKMLDNLHAILPYREIQERKEIAFQILELDERLMEITSGLIIMKNMECSPRRRSQMNQKKFQN